MKKIVLLSDGTGNGAAKRHKTNVWPLYEALDVHGNNQIAFYDDGVAGILVVQAPRRRIRLGSTSLRAVLTSRCDMQLH